MAEPLKARPTPGPVSVARSWAGSSGSSRITMTELYRAPSGASKRSSAPPRTKGVASSVRWFTTMPELPTSVSASQASAAQSM